MLFDSPIFLFVFLPLSILLHRLALGRTAVGKAYPNLTKLVLFLTTLVFYAYGNPFWLIPFFISIGFDFTWSRVLERLEKPIARKAIIALSIIQNLSLLSLYKYSNALAEMFRHIPPLHFLIAKLPATMPAGISFYTFESLSFVIDCYRRKMQPSKNPLDFFAFIGMYPRFIAGPIARYVDISEQFLNYKGMQIVKGLSIFIHGLFLKKIFADSFAIFTHYAFSNTEALGTLSAWVGVLSYTFQIYFDFNGYSLMALGLGYCFGFEFPLNFNLPYHAESIKDFWRRWHISLSQWLRDYLYISLGGNKKGVYSTYFNLFITMLLGGLWHGSQWTFVYWGAWHGLGLVVEKRFRLDEKLPRAFRKVNTFLFVVMGWVFFRSSSLSEALSVFRNLFSFHGSFNPELIQLNPMPFLCCLLAVYYCFFIENKKPILYFVADQFFSLQQALMAAVKLGFSFNLDGLSNSIVFLYFQF